MSPLTLAPVSGRYLSFAEREEIAVQLARGCGVREIARQLGRTPSTISRELQRNAALMRLLRVGKHKHRIDGHTLWTRDGRCRMSGWA
jgi:IS30 family transposase